MKTIEVNLYTYDELSDKAKLNALIEYQCNCEYDWGYEVIDSLKVFMNAVGVELTDYQIDWLNPSASRVMYNGAPHSEPIKEELTGSFSVGFDPYYYLTKTWNKTKSIELAVSKLLKDCADDYEYQLSEEAYAEHCQANEYWFNENGKLI